MKILVTGSKGFMGRNLIAELRNRGYSDILEYTSSSNQDDLDNLCRQADFVYHLAGVNRPDNPADFMTGNHDLLANILNKLKKYNNKCPVLLSSSIQAEQDNPYGESKLAAEQLLINYSTETGVAVIIYRFPNTFGKWSRPNYNSVVATFCHNIARDLAIKVDNPETVLSLLYIDDLLDELIYVFERMMKENNTDIIDYNYAAGNGCKLGSKESRASRESRAFQGGNSFVGNNSHSYYQVDNEKIHKVKLGKIAELLYSFKESRESLLVPDMSDDFTKKLYSTYLSYLPEEEFSYELKMNSDDRGSFTEFIKSSDRGQVSVNISKAGITKGNHWHHTKNEKFLVVSGRGVIRFRQIDSADIIEYYVSGDNLEVIDIPTGYTHNIENMGDTDMVTIMWANEVYNPDKPDTFFLKV